MQIYLNFVVWWAQINNWNRKKAYYINSVFLMPQITLFLYIGGNLKSKDLRLFHLIFTVAKIWKQSKCPLVDEWIKHLWDIYTMEYYSTIKKEEKFTFCHSMNGPGEYYAKWNKPVRGRQIPYFTHMCYLMNKLN